MNAFPPIRFNSPDPLDLARDAASELVRAAVAVASFCDEHRDGRGAVSVEQLIDELRDGIAERLVEMMRAFPADDMNAMILELAEAIDAIGFGDALDLRDAWVFRRWADPLAFTHDDVLCASGPAAGRVSLLRAGVVVLADSEHGGQRTITASGPTADAARAALAAVAPGAVLDWAGPAPRRLAVVPCASYRPREPDLLRVWVAVEADGHVDELVVAEDEDEVVVLAVVCTSAAHALREVRHEPHRVWLDEALGSRTVIDGATGRPLPLDRP